MDDTQGGVLPALAETELRTFENTSGAKFAKLPL
jgi:hypothetical protein